MKSIVALLTLLALGCATLRSDRAQERPDFERYFEAAGVEGTFVLYELEADQYQIYNPERARRAFIPASTYKIFNSLVALETGAVADVEEVVAWDGVQRGWNRWNQDHSMRTAFRYSAVWFYQEMARRIGVEQMQHWVDAAGYGNRDLSGAIDRFWLYGGLRITPMQQIDFLVRLYRNDLPFSRHSMDLVKDIMVLETGDDYVLRGKTGWADTTPQVGWFVGYLTTEEEAYFFATNIDIVRDKMGEDEAARVGITRQILHDLHLMPALAPVSATGGR